MRVSTLEDADLARSHGVAVRVNSLYGEDLEVTDIPVISGELSAAAGVGVPERLTLTVPVKDGATVWEPSDPTSPLNSFGQRLEVTYLVRTGRGLADIEVPLGVFRVESWSADRDVVSVEAVGLMQVLEDARLTVPSSPGPAMTFSEAIEYLAEDLLPLDIDAALTDRAVAQVVQWDDDRLGAIRGLVDAWPARMYVSSLGVLTVAPLADDADPVVTWQDGELGTVVSAPRGGGRDGIYNAVIARSSSSDLSESAVVLAQAAVYDLSGESPVRWDGPFGWVPYFYSSPLITTAAQAQATARTILQRVTRHAATREVTAIPDPRIEIGDRVTVVTTEHSGPTSIVGEVLSYGLPLSADQGPAAYMVSTMPTMVSE